MRRDRGDHFGVKLFHQRQHIIALDEGHFQVELGELRLTVAAQVFITEAARDLEVAVHACHHQQLLQLLRRLRQGIELSRIDAGGDKIVARAFGRCLEQDRRFDLDKALLIEKIAHELDHLVAQDHIAGHALAAQVEIAIFEARIFIRQVVLAADHEGQGLGRVQYFDRLGDDLDLACLHLGIFHTGRPFLDSACDLQHPFHADVGHVLQRFLGCIWD